MSNIFEVRNIFLYILLYYFMFWNMFLYILFYYFIFWNIFLYILFYYFIFWNIFLYILFYYFIFWNIFFSIYLRSCIQFRCFDVPCRALNSLAVGGVEFGDDLQEGLRFVLHVIAVTVQQRLELRHHHRNPSLQTWTVKDSFSQTQWNNRNKKCLYSQKG